MAVNEQGQVSLEVLLDGDFVYRSYGKWLHPLFDLEEHLRQHPVVMGQALVRDKIVGKAAALLILRLGAGRVQGEVMSDLAITVFENADLPHTYGERVTRIDCQTEEILLDIDDPEEAYHILCKRASRC